MTCAPLVLAMWKNGKGNYQKHILGRCVLLVLDENDWECKLLNILRGRVSGLLSIKQWQIFSSEWELEGAA